MNKSESKYFNTALLMDEALLQLLEKKDLEFITVKEICERAGVNRSTFYLHYETISDLLDETAEMIDRRFSQYLGEDSHFSEKIPGKELSELVLINEEQLLPYLRFIKDNKAVYRATFRNPNAVRADEKYEYLKNRVIEPILMRFDIPKERHRYYINYYIEGIMAIVKRWLMNDCRDSVEEIAAVIEDCVLPRGA
ncbi:MAG: TetR/AcrR family transcriptional regulator [Oscillospiraceae bacterium]|nr:TetR/AcrR family transcriptional regulator [Oscillospiraceae bacterium]